MGIQISAIHFLAFSPDSRYLISGMTNGTFLVWDVAESTRPPSSARVLEGGEWDRAWTDLAGKADKAQAAIGVLTAAPAQTIALFEERLVPAKDVPAERVRRLVADLDSEDFPTRAAADRELKELGDLAGPALRRVLEKKPSLEARRRIESVLSAARRVHRPEALRRLRAVRVLEQLDTPKAAMLLRKLAQGAPAARETLAAREALTRRERIPNATPAPKGDKPKKSEKKIPVILDTDIGTDVDDAFALALLLASPELDLRGVTTVGTNPRTRARMVCRFLSAAGRGKIPVAAGTEPQPTEEIAKQGKYATLPEDLRDLVSKPAKETAVELLYRQLKVQPGKLTLLTIGPLTNIARLLKEHPDCKPWIKRIVLMGGAVRVGYNGKAPPEVEWNIKCDIPAARAVFASGVPLVVAPLDATTMLKLEEPLRNRLFQSETPLTNPIRTLYRLWNERTPTLFDPVAAMLCFDERFCTMENLRLEVDDKGMTRVVKGKPNARVATAIRGDDFLKWYVDRVASASK